MHQSPRRSKEEGTAHQRQASTTDNGRYSLLEDILTQEDQQLPNPDYEKRILNRKRAVVRPPEPTSFDYDLNLSGCDVPNESLQGDVREGGGRHLIVASADQLRLLLDVHM